MKVFDLTLSGWGVIKKFTSKDGSREALTGVEFSRVNKDAIRITATDGHLLISGVFSNDTVQYVLEKEHSKVGAFSEKSGIYFLESFTKENEISISQFKKTIDIPYPDASKGFNLTFEKIAEGRTGIYDPKFGPVLCKAVSEVFSTGQIFIPKYQKKDDIHGLLCWFADPECDSVIGVMPLRDFSSKGSGVQDYGKTIEVNVQTGKKGVSLSGVSDSIKKRPAPTKKQKELAKKKALAKKKTLAKKLKK